MLALRKISPDFGVSLMDVAPPEKPAPGEVLVEVEAAGICGSDLHIYDAKGSAYANVWPRLPLTLGHEFCGRVVQLGDGAAADLLGRRVVALPVGIGIQRNGCFAPMVAVAAVNCLPVPDTLDSELGALIEPLTVSENALALSETGPGKRLLIMGAGTLAQGAALFARLAGASQIVVTGFADAHRFEVLRQMGFDLLIDRAEPGSAERLAALAGDGFDAVIEMTGVMSTIDEGLHALRRKGIFVATGIHPEKATVDITRMVRQQLQLRGSYGNTREGWHKVIAQVTANPETFRPLITHRYPLHQAVQAFETAYARIASKAILHPQQKN
ncbi:zinc-binding dehydrogenase [Variovorax sp. LjRoot290]|uniref:zinc-dependent alcohol dehydrogenase n=1 Tax=unclassified Variovorax TaxID=663243 RepID=UPI003ECCAC35